MDNSNYNALQVILKQRMSNGLQFMVNYTWGAEIDDNGTFRSGYLPTRVERSRGLSDTPQVLNSTLVWDMPFGEGRTFNPGNRFVRSLVSGYQLSGIYTYNSGIPLAVTSSGCVESRTGPVHAQLQSGLLHQPTHQRQVRRWRNGDPLAFLHRHQRFHRSVRRLEQDSFGRSALSQLHHRQPGPHCPYGLRAPNAYDIDMSLKRTITLHEKYKIVLDAQAFNLTNVVIFSTPPVSTSTASTFGTVTGQSNLSRDIQLEGRFNF